VRRHRERLRGEADHRQRVAVLGRGIGGGELRLDGGDLPLTGVLGREDRGGIDGDVAPLALDAEDGGGCDGRQLLVLEPDGRVRPGAHDEVRLQREEGLPRGQREDLGLTHVEPGIAKDVGGNGVAQRREHHHRLAPRGQRGERGELVERHDPRRLGGDRDVPEGVLHGSGTALRAAALRSVVTPVLGTATGSQEPGRHGEPGGENEGSSLDVIRHDLYVSHA
jgi:hypothetical protein